MRTEWSVTDEMKRECLADLAGGSWNTAGGWTKALYLLALEQLRDAGFVECDGDSNRRATWTITTAGRLALSQRGEAK